jgi:outer membrane protein
MWIMVSAGAQSAADTATDKWDLNRCLEYALENNVQLNKSRLSYASAEASLMQAKGQRLPNLNASISENGSNNRMRDPMTDELGDWKFSVNGSASLNTGVTLYSGGAINNEIQRSTLAKEAALLSVDQTEMDISIAVVQAYVNVLYAYENLKYYKEVVDLSTKQVERSRRLLEAGSVSRRDIADMEAQLASDNYSVVTATNTLTQRITDLKALLQIPVEQRFDVYIPEEEINVILDALPDIYDVYEATLRNVPDVKYSELQKQMAEIDLKSAKAGYLPTLSASASIGTSYMDPYSLSAGTQFSDNLNERIGLTLSIPIFNRFSTKANVARSKINIESASLTLDNTRNALLQEVERIYQETQAGQQRYLAAIAQKNASEESFSIAQEQYALGMLNSIELQQSRNMWLNANRELIQSRFNALLYRKILDYYLGIPLTM